MKKISEKQENINQEKLNQEKINQEIKKDIKLILYALEIGIIIMSLLIIKVLLW